MKTTNTSKKGKAIEHHIIYELLKDDFDVYTPIVDTGTDLIIKDKEGGFVEIQVKSRVLRGEDDYFPMKDFKWEYNFFIICYNIKEDVFFVIPSKIFDRHSTIYQEGGKKRRKLLWSLLKNMKNYKGQNGLDLLGKALSQPRNRVSLFNENGKKET